MNLQIIFNSFITFSFYLIIAVSFSIIFSTIRFFHIAHGAVFAVGGYAAYSLLYFLSMFKKDNEIPFIIYVLAVICAMIASGIVGILIDRLIYLPLRRRRASNLILLLASFGVFIFIQNLIALIFRSKVLSIRTGQIEEGYKIFGAVITKTQVVVILSSLIIFLFLLIITHFTKLGKAMRAIADDPITASTVGIDSEKVILFTIALGSAFVGYGGFLVSLETNLEPMMGFNILLKGIIAVVIGGVGSITGAFLGSLFVGFTENLVIWFFPTGWKDAIIFIIFLFFLLFKPQGILGKKEEKAN